MTHQGLNKERKGFFGEGNYLFRVRWAFPGLGWVEVGDCDLEHFCKKSECEELNAVGEHILLSRESQGQVSVKG